MIKSYSRRLLVSFSGGETSALMASILVSKFRADKIGGRYDEIIVVMANTGEEDEKTLTFSQNCNDLYAWNMKIVEFESGLSFREVTFNTLSRNGEPFEKMIQRYGIPNPSYRHCNRELKLVPITRYLRSIGWGPGTYDTAIGIRADEMDRKDEKEREKKLVYPLCDWWPVGKPEVNSHWLNQPFRLGLRSYQGNCKTCWKKSLRKLAMIAKESPEKFDFFCKMETLYSSVGPEFSSGRAESGYRRTFFRGERTVADIIELSKNMTNLNPDDLDDTSTLSLFPLNFDPDLDTDSSCGSESCEIDNAGDLA